MRLIVSSCAAALLAAGCSSDNRRADNDYDSGLYGHYPSGSKSTPRSTSTGSAAGADVAVSPQQFVQDTAWADRTEIVAGRLAVQRAQDDRVKDFAQRMIDDHQKVDRELRQIADSKNFSIPQPIRDAQPITGELASLSGPDFDRQYMQMMVGDHVRAVREFELQAQSGDDPELRAFAQRTLPTLRDHLSQARALARDLGIQISDSSVHGNHVTPSNAGKERNNPRG